MKNDDTAVIEAHQVSPITPESESCNEIHPDALALARLIYDIYREEQGRALTSDVG